MDKPGVLVPGTDELAEATHGTRLCEHDFIMTSKRHIYIFFVKVNFVGVFKKEHIRVKLKSMSFVIDSSLPK